MLRIIMAPARLCPIDRRDNGSIALGRPSYKSAFPVVLAFSLAAASLPLPHVEDRIIWRWPLGKIHLKCIRLAKDHYDLVGFYETDPEVARRVEEEFHLKAFETPGELIAEVDVIDVVTPTPSHYRMVKMALEGGCHVFVENP
jgi:hypothetical protein